MDCDPGWKLAEEYDGKRPASLDQFLDVVGITEEEFEEILLDNEVFDWGFDHDKIQPGKPLPEWNSGTILSKPKNINQFE